MINKVFLIGRVGKDSTVTTTDRGSKVLKFSLATWVSIKDESHESGWKTVTEWHNIVSWTDFADSLAQKVKKGVIVSVVGSLRYREYEKEGVKHYVTEIIGDVKVVPQTKVNEAPEAQKPEESKVQEENTNLASEKTDDDDLPFR